MRLIGIDLAYSKPIRIAVLSSRGRLSTLGTVDVDDSLLEMAKRVHRYILPFYDSLVVFEQPGLYNNRKTGLKLIKLATMIDVYLDESNIPSIQIRPQEWQKYMLGKVENKKKASIAKATEIFGSKIPHPLDDNEADALNIAYFAMKNSKQLLKRTKDE